MRKRREAGVGLCGLRPHLDTGDCSGVGDTCVGSGERKASEVLGVDTRSVFDDQSVMHWDRWDVELLEFQQGHHERIGVASLLP